MARMNRQPLSFHPARVAGLLIERRNVHGFS
jgi:hypothetical protein